ncbi:hypothetical protein [Citrobacter farmeri]|uniref:hypothetical protein n=1 Tax=Citrobacter farmeri TaxID=67824 RepID=UPI0029338175|nr:hypothetical protein [Salmonella enterica subsp. enterica serovar Uganda]HEC2075169.1 hypothetical protein [Klebsiella oxytoca]
MGKLTIDLLVMDDACDPYICGVRGACTIEDLQAIEKEIVENRDDYLPADGTYTIEAVFLRVSTMNMVVAKLLLGGNGMSLSFHLLILVRRPPNERHQ